MVMELHEPFDPLLILFPIDIVISYEFIFSWGQAKKDDSVHLLSFRKNWFERQLYLPNSAYISPKKPRCLSDRDCLCLFQSDSLKA